MEWTRLIFLVVSMSVFYCADAQAGTTANPSFGYTLKENLRATMSVMLVSFFAAFVFMGIFSLYIYHCSYRYGTHRGPLEAATDLCHGGMNRQAIEKCPILVYSAVKDLKIGRGTLECAVCLNEFQDMDNIRLLPKCHHVFHRDCIDEWLLPHMSCPVCRTTLSSDVAEIINNIATTTTTTTPASSNSGNSIETEQQQQHQVVEVVVHDDMAEGESGESDVTVNLPRSHSTGHSVVESSGALVVDRYTLLLPEHVRRQILVSDGRVQRVATSDVVLPGAWSSKRVWYRGESNSAVERLLLVSGGMGLGFFGSDDNILANPSEEGVHGTRCWTPLRMSFSTLQEHTARKPPSSL